MIKLHKKTEKNGPDIGSADDIKKQLKKQIHSHTLTKLKRINNLD